MTDPEHNPMILQLVLDNLTSDTIPDLTSYPCSREQFLAIKQKALQLNVSLPRRIAPADLLPK